MELLEIRTLLSASPVVQSITRVNSQTTGAASVDFLVTFSGDVSGVDADDFLAVPTGTVQTTGLQVTPVSGATYTVTVSGISGSGTLGLNLVDDNSIRDGAGQGLVSAAAPLTFGAQQSFAVNTYSASIGIADVNGDGIADLVLTNYYNSEYSASSDNISVLLGNGDGTFQPRISSTLGVDISYDNASVAIGDIDGDGLADLAITNRYDNYQVFVLLGNGDGFFRPPQIFGTGAYPSYVVLGDVDGDGNLDVVTANNDANGALSVLLGNGDGMFQPQQTLPTSGSPEALAIADLDGDGHADLVVLSREFDTVSVLLGNGDGTFQNQQPLATGSSPVALFVGDVNGDGLDDLVVGNYGDYTVSVLLGNGDGTFRPQQTSAVSSPYLRAAGDVNGDGRLDLILIDYGYSRVNVLLGQSDGTFAAPQTFATGSYPGLGTVGDLNGDGRMDLAIANFGDHTTSVLLNTASGPFTGEIYNINAPPTLTGASSVSYSENDAPLAINTSIVVGDSDSSTLSSATISVTNYVSGEDVLGYTNDGLTMGNIAVASNAGDVLTLTSAGGAATLSQWQAALRAVTYANSSDTPTTTTRSVSFVVNDGTSASNTLTSDVSITAVNDAPVLAGVSNPGYTENGPPTPINSVLTVNDLDNNTLTSATITITDYVGGEDGLGFTNDGSTMGNIAVTSNASGVLTLTSAGGTATLAQWQAALRAVTYANTSDKPSPTTRSVSFVVNDGTSSSNAVTSAVTITAVNDAPVLAGSSPAVYTENGPAVPIDSVLTVNDLDNNTLTSATITITNFVAGEDVSGFINDGLTMGNIAVASYANGELTLTSASGTATLAQWQAALRAVTYVNTSENPGSGTRSVSFAVNDGMSPSNTLTGSVSITAVNDAPVLVGTSLVDYTENGPPVLIDTGLTVSDVDDATLASATVKFASFIAGEDALGFANDGLTMGNIAVASYANGELTLTSAGSTATLAQWQAALRAVTYSNTSENPNPTPRSIAFGVNDGAASSSTLTSTVNVIAVNDAPVLSGTSQAEYTEDEPPAPINAVITVNDLDNAALDSATITIANYVADEDVPGFSNDGLTMGNIAVASNANGVLTLTSSGGTATLAEWQAALRAVTYANTSDDPTTTPRSVSFVVNDGTSASNAVTSTIDIHAVSGIDTAARPGMMFVPRDDGQVLRPSPSPLIAIVQLITVDADTPPEQLVYTVGQVSGGRFVFLADPGTPIVHFTQADVDAGLVGFVYDSPDVAPSMDLSVTDGTTSLPVVIPDAEPPPPLTKSAVVDGVLYVVGTSGEDIVTIKQKGRKLIVKFKDGPTIRKDLSDVNQIVLMLHGGHDRVKIRPGVTLPISSEPPAPLRFASTSALPSQSDGNGLLPQESAGWTTALTQQLDDDLFTDTDWLGQL